MSEGWIARIVVAVVMAVCLGWFEMLALIVLGVLLYGIGGSGPESSGLGLFVACFGVSLVGMLIWLVLVPLVAERRRNPRTR